MSQTKNYQLVRVFILMFLITPGLALSSCLDPILEQERKVGPFTGINVGGAFDVILSQTGNQKVVIEAEQDVIDKVRTEVKGDVLHIDMEWEWSWKGNDKVTVYIDIRQLESLEVSGAGDVKGETPIKADELELRVSGAGDVDLDVSANSMDVVISGAGDVNISGKTDRQKVRLSGAGDYKAQNFKSSYTYAKASGAGSVEVYASDEIDAYASGAGSIKYYGDPEKQQTNSSGAGSVRSR
jgi:hypothetical protein